jgi:hypothetical protein
VGDDEPLADANRSRLRQQPGRRGGARWAGEEITGGSGEGLGPREPLADARGAWERQPGGAVGNERGRATDGGYQLPPFPPGRADLAGWARVLAVRPDLAPALPQPRVRGLAYGLGTRVDGPSHLIGIDWRAPLRSDRLRAGGNGVVPQQAAHAWRGLWAHLFG